MDNKINLSNSQKRVISATMKIIEESLDDLLIKIETKDNLLTKVKIDVDYNKLNQLSSTIETIKQKSSEIFNKFELDREEYLSSQIINSKKAYLWSILSDLNSNKLEKYGYMENNSKNKINHEVENLLNLINIL